MRSRSSRAMFALSGALVIAALLAAAWGSAGRARAEQQEQQGGVSSLWDALGPAVDVGLKFGEQAGQVATKAAGAVLNTMDSMHTILLMMGARVEVEVQYEPMDVPNGMHVRESLSEQYEDKRIRVDATVYFSEDLEDMLPAASVRKWFGAKLPKKGDTMAGVPVHFNFPKSLMPYLDIRARHFDSLNPTWTKYTDQNGVATIYLYVIHDQPMGGERGMIEGSLQVDVPIGQSKGPTLNPLDLVVRPLGEAVAKPVSASRTLQIERHKPTKFQGTVTLQRTLTSQWSNTALDPPAGEGAFTRATGAATWTERVEFANLTFDERGVGLGDYDYMLLGRIQGVTVAKSNTWCKDIPRMLTSTYDYNGVVQDRNQNVAQVQISVDRRSKDQKYTVAVMTNTITGSPFGLARSVGGSIKAQIQTCDGPKNSTIPFSEDESCVAAAAGLPLTKIVSAYDHIRSGWKPFDPDATVLAGSGAWDEPSVASPDGRVTMTISNTMTWSFRRVPGEE